MKIYSIRVVSFLLLFIFVRSFAVIGEMLQKFSKFYDELQDRGNKVSNSIILHNL